MGLGLVDTEAGAQACKPKTARPTKATSNTKRMVLFRLIFIPLCAEPKSNAEWSGHDRSYGLDFVVCCFLILDQGSVTGQPLPEGSFGTAVWARKKTERPREGLAGTES